MLASIVIRAYNEEQYIARLLEGIAQQSIKDIETILVDSGSTDKTVQVASRYPVRILHVKPEEFTFGFSLNRGIANANGELVVIASAHVYPVYPDWLEHLLAPFTDPQVALTYGKQRGDESTLFSEQQIFAHWFPHQSQVRQSHPFCNNANAAIRRSFWESHAYDENLPGLEDIEWGNWALHQGYTLSYIAEAEIRHVHQESLRHVYNRYRREGMAFKRIFPHEHFHLGDFVRLYLSNTASDLWHAFRQSCFSHSAGNIFWFRLMQFWGTYQGFRSHGLLTQHLRQTFYYPHGYSAQPANPARNVKPIDYKDEQNV